MLHESIYELDLALEGVVAVTENSVSVVDEAVLRNTLIDHLIRDAVFGTVQVKAYAKWLIWEIGQALGVRPASIHDFYMARGHGEYTNVTVPAMNLRMMTYDMMRAAMRAANRSNAAAIIFELARSEMAFANVPPDEYSACAIAAALREGYDSPLFIQGDHFQVNPKLYASEPEKAIQEVKDLAAHAIPAGFWNIDIDTSTLVTLEPESLVEQQRRNFEHSAEITDYIRSIEPAGVTISLGGEIGEVGLENSTVGELDAYMENYEQALRGYGEHIGLSKVSVATGTSHGGVVQADGTLADVAVDFDLLDELGERARHHRAGGAVQHGASTLPRDVFHRFPETQTMEIHLAAGFVNLVLDHPAFPADLLASIYQHLDDNIQNERKAGDSDDQFHYKSRKNAAGSHKAELWRLPADAYNAIMPDLEAFFLFLFEQLGAANTRELVAGIVSPVEFHQPKPMVKRYIVEDQGLAD